MKTQNKTGRVTVLVILGTVFPVVMMPVNVVRAIGGLSNSKVATLGGETAGYKTLELEPGFGYYWTRRIYDQNWHTHKTPWRATSAFMAFRVTVGLADPLEAGFSLPVVFEELDGDPNAPRSGMGIGDIPVGLKWTFFKTRRVFLALMAGVTAPTGDDNPGPDRLPTGAGYTTLDVGLGLTVRPNKAVSVDVDSVASLNLGIGADDPRWGWTTTAAFGYMIKPGFQPVVEFAYLGGFNHGDDSHKLVATVGYTININPKWTLINGVSFDLAGKRETQGFYVMVAATTRFFGGP